MDTARPEGDGERLIGFQTFLELAEIGVTDAKDLTDDAVIRVRLAGLLAAERPKLLNKLVGVHRIFQA